MTGQTRPGGSPLLLARALKHRHGATQALAGIDLDVREREILGIVGPGGSGKTTLIEALSGRFPVDAGSTVFRGFPIRLRSRRDAGRIGIALVERDPRLVPDLSVFDNVVLPLLGRSARTEPPDLRRRVGVMLAGLGEGEAPDMAAKAASLTTVQAWQIAVARALITRAKLYLFDDAFASLSPRDADALAGIMGKLRLAGCGLIVTARRLDDLLPLVDRVTMLDAGVGVLTASARTEEGRAALRHAAGGARPGGPRGALPERRHYRLEVAGLDADGVREASFAVAGGEVVALHGGRGAGCSHLAEAVAGVVARSAGSVKVDATRLAPGRPPAARRAGLAFCGPGMVPLLPDASGRTNLALMAPAVDPDLPLEALCEVLGLSADVLARPLGQQPAGVCRRVLLAGALLAGHAAVVLVDPAHGLDAGERDAALAALRVAAARGRAVLAVCRDAAEADGVADRVLVMRGGQIVGEAARPLLDAEMIDAMAMPPAAVERGAALLDDLTRENGGAAFWALLRDDHVVCLGSAVSEREADPGLRPTRVIRLDGTSIREALARRDPAGFVVEPDGARRTLLTPLPPRRGRPMGWVGLTLGPSRAASPPAAAVAFRVETLAASL